MREFIKAEFPNRLPSAQYSRIILDFKDGASLLIEVGKLFSINTHRPKLVHFERLPILPNALWGENRTAFAAIDLDDGKKKRKPSKQGEDKDTKNDVESSFYRAISFSVISSLKVLNSSGHDASRGVLSSSSASNK